MNRSERGREHWPEAAEPVARVVERWCAAPSSQEQSQPEESPTDLAVAFSRGEL